MERSNEPRYAPGSELTLHPEEQEKREEIRYELPARPADFETSGELSPRAVQASEMPMLGAVTQDDPMPGGMRTYPDTGSEGYLTLVAVFENITGAEACAEDLKQRGLGIEVAFVSRRGDGPEQGLRPGNVITGEDYGLSAAEESPPKDVPMGSGVAVGATIGATAGLLATYVIPPLGPVLGAGPLISTLAGAGLGSFLGGLSEWSARDEGDDASIYAGQVRRGGLLMLVRCGREEADQVRRAIEVWSPLEIRVQ